MLGQTPNIFAIFRRDNPSSVIRLVSASAPLNAAGVLMSTRYMSKRSQCQWALNCHAAAHSTEQPSSLTMRPDEVNEGMWILGLGRRFTGHRVYGRHTLRHIAGDATPQHFGQKKKLPSSTVRLDRVRIRR